MMRVRSQKIESDYRQSHKLQRGSALRRRDAARRVRRLENGRAGGVPPSGVAAVARRKARGQTNAALTISCSGWAARCLHLASHIHVCDNGAMATNLAIDDRLLEEALR